MSFKVKLHFTTPYEKLTRSWASTTGCGMVGIITGNLSSPQGRQKSLGERIRDNQMVLRSSNLIGPFCRQISILCCYQCFPEVTLKLVSTFLTGFSRLRKSLWSFPRTGAVHGWTTSLAWTAAKSSCSSLHKHDNWKDNIRSQTSLSNTEGNKVQYQNVNILLNVTVTH